MLKNFNSRRVILVGIAMAFITFLTVFIVILASVDLLHIDNGDHAINGINVGKAGCLIDLNKDLTFKHPLILDPKTNDFLLPGANGFQLNAGDKIILACTGYGNFITAGSTKQELVLECLKDNIFVNKTFGYQNPLKDFTCNGYPDPIIRKTGNKCSGKYTEIEIGFNVSLGFIRTIATCFNETNKDALYSVYNLVTSINRQQSSVPRPNNFKDGGFYPGLNLNDLYTKKTELSTFSKLLKSDDLAKKYIQVKDDYYFISKGHLTAKADFLYGSQQRSTFFYVNAAPQWQIFNGKNWNTLEQDTRTFASKNNLDLTVYTGVWGISSLSDINNKSTELYLYVDKNSANNKLTVPEVFWKVLYDPKSKHGISFVGHNNPYETDVAKRQICASVCNKISWLHWEATSVTKGYSYCCEVDDLRKNVTYLPDIDVRGLLV